MQAHRACFKMPADPRNPYVYAHTGTDAMNLVAEIERAAKQAEGTDTLIALAVPTPDTWPLPWYLRKYRNVGYWNRVEDIPAELHRPSSSLPPIKATWPTNASAAASAPPSSASAPACC